MSQASKRIHHDLSSKELHHIFGVKRKQDVPTYTTIHQSPITRLGTTSLHTTTFPRSTDSHDQDPPFHYDVTHEGQTYTFNLTSQHRRLFSPGFHAVERNANHSKLIVGRIPECLFSGHSTSHPGAWVSVAGCGSKHRALVTIPDSNEHLVVQPLAGTALTKYHARSTEQQPHNTHPHVIYKRSTKQFHTISSPLKAESEEGSQKCLYDKSDDPYKNVKQRDDPLTDDDNDPYERLAVVRGPVVVELGVFVDDAMWSHFRDIYGNDADTELLEFILAAVNNIHLLFTHSSLNPPVNIVITRYEVLKTPPIEVSQTTHSRGNVDLLLENFCDYQHRINPKSDGNHRHWDHGILFSGYDLYRGKLKSVAGYAPVKGMCSGSRSCTINEGLDFGAVFVITHEMGHSLGMVHDGDNGCNRHDNIMSPSVGAGKTSWSKCSNKEYNVFVSRLGAGRHPGELYSLDQQCRIFHGECWEHELKEPDNLEEVCSMVWCGAGEGLIRTAHPALEGTMCGKNKWCREGQCVGWSASQAPRPIHGAWTAWSDSMPRKSYGHESDCGGYKCSACDIVGQYRLKRSLRLCENPAPNFGGKSCTGSKFRGIVCGRTVCKKGRDVNDYATKKCLDLKRDPGVPNFLLTGRGFQCKFIKFVLC